ncbi:hypothetical protein BX600DRAFT_17402 [Xylariales sp. PMI_506]|nr:hypothetical protein BX600DRAFT_17402 [Xylariales sp. PMI_506]
MEPKKVSSAVGSTITDNPLRERGGPAARHMSQRLRGSIELRRQSRSSLSSETRSIIASSSCVARQTPEDDCAKQRFIVWAAVKRNRSVRMPTGDRLRCPLLRCGGQFSDHEAMLRHLAECEHLGSGEYVCYDCTRIERFTDARCKCCLGNPTKRRRIINMAKTFFSTLGHKSKKPGGIIDASPEEFIMPPPSYDSLEIEEQPQEQLPLEPEMGGNEILELDAGTVLPVQLDPVNYEQPQDTPSTCNQYGNSLWHMSLDSACHASPNHSLAQVQTNNGSRPSLYLDTHNIGPPSKVARTTYLSPSSSLRSTNRSQGIISPISAGSGSWTNGSTMNTTLASPITPFSSDESDPGSLSRENSCKFPRDYPIGDSGRVYWSQPVGPEGALETSSIEVGNDYIIDHISELPADNPAQHSVPRVWDNDSFLFSFSAKDNYSWPSSVDTEVNMLFTGNNVAAEAAINTEQEATGCETKTLVRTAWEALEQHVAYSIPNVKHIDNSLARQLESLGVKDIALKGLATLRNILDGVDPRQAIDYICFIHLVYALAIVIHEEEASIRCKKLFKQALAYRGFLAPAEHQDYSPIVMAIWQSSDTDELDTSASMTRSSSFKGKNPELRSDPSVPFKVDPLMEVAQNFLDDLEMSVVSSNGRPAEVLTSDLWSIHLSELGPNSPPSSKAFSITGDYIVRELSKNFYPVDQSGELVIKLKSVSQRMSVGSICTLRRLELELLQAGKTSLPLSEFFDEFIPQVRGLCDPIYALDGFNPRTRYQGLGVALIEHLIPSFDVSLVSPTSAFSTSLPTNPDTLEDFLELLGNAFPDDDFIVPTETEINGTLSDPLVQGGGTTSIGSIQPTAIATQNHITIDPSNLSRVGSETQMALPTAREAENEDLSTCEISSPSPRGLEETSSTSMEGSSFISKVEANSCCEICGYRPKGDPQWFKGSMAKHKKLQHSTDPPKIYKCSYPGCTSAYKNRPDNLRQHQIEKGHFVDGIDGKGKRPGKRKKMEE